MANMTPNRIGAVNEQGGDKLALFLTQFGGEVLTAFQETNVAEARTTNRVISSGKTAQFPATWKGTASYHTPGTQLLGTRVAANERTISIDDLLVADRSLAQIDDAMNHYDFRSVLSRDIGMALARKFDQQLLQVMTLAARADGTVTDSSAPNGGSPGGTRVIGAISDADDLGAAIFEAAQALDEKDVPSENRSVFVKPNEYYMLVQGLDKVISRDFNPTANGGYAEGAVHRIAGIEIVKTNNLPSSNVTSGPTAYRGNFSTVKALVTTPAAAGTVKLISLSMEAEWLIEYQCWLLLGKYAVGHGILRPECAVEITTAATS